MAMRKQMKMYTGRPSWYHPHCMFLAFNRTKCGTNTITTVNDLEGFDELEPWHQPYVKLLTMAANPFLEDHVLAVLLDGEDEPPKNKSHAETDFSETITSHHET